VLVIADERFVDLEVAEQIARVPRILGGNDVHILERLERPQRDIAEVSDWCRN
jgi:hypothetical protein